MLASQITRVVESFTSLTDSDFVYKSIKCYIMCPDMAFWLTHFLYTLNYFTEGDYFKSYVKQNKGTWYESVLPSLGQELIFLTFGPLEYLFQIKTNKEVKSYQYYFVACRICLLQGQPGLMKVRGGDGKSRKHSTLLDVGGDTG